MKWSGIMLALCHQGMLCMKTARLLRSPCWGSNRGHCSSCFSLLLKDTTRSIYTQNWVLDAGRQGYPRAGVSLIPSASLWTSRVDIHGDPFPRHVAYRTELHSPRPAAANIWSTTKGRGILPLNEAGGDEEHMDAGMSLGQGGSPLLLRMKNVEDLTEEEAGVELVALAEEIAAHDLLYYEVCSRCFILICVRQKRCRCVYLHM
ncbi:unnamed protein product [Discosporangium mesarthrocarpum]